MPCKLTEKRCSLCKTTKPRSEFADIPRTDANGVRADPRCKTCRAAYGKQSRSKPFRSGEVKLCECGCGHPTNPAPTTVPSLGWVLGYPMRFIRGHNARSTPYPDHIYEVRDTGYKTPCWIWLFNTDRDGYGKTQRNGVTMRAHRFMFEREFGAIPDGLVLDHLCRITSCVNPEHLEPVTNEENILRGNGRAALNARKTHCDHGHPLAGDNLYIYDGRRKCRTCSAQRQQEYRARKRSA